LSDIGFPGIKLDISSLDLQDFIWTGLDFMKNMSSSGGTGKAHPKLGGRNLFEDQFRRENQFDPLFFPMNLF
jgi:hypothetical protein